MSRITEPHAMLHETQCEYFQLRFSFAGSLWSVLMMLLCTSLWDKCLFLDITSPNAGITRILLGKQNGAKIYDGEQGKDNSFASFWDQFLRRAVIKIYHQMSS